MKSGQHGTARNGQHGTILEVDAHTVRFLSDTGARYTLLPVEFTPDSATAAEKRTIRATAKKFFSAIGPNDGFAFGYVWRGKRIAAAFLKRIPGYLGIPDAKPDPQYDEAQA